MMKDKDRLLDELEAENDRLREELNGLQRSHDQLADQYAGVVAENDRLREALAERVPEIVENLKRGGGAAAAWAKALEAERDRMREALKRIAADTEADAINQDICDIAKAALAKEVGE